MGWETRKGRRYYYWAEWRNGRCIKTYRGARYLAELDAQMDEIKREERRREAAEAKQTRDHLADLDAENARAFKATRELVAVMLATAGYHRHHRGEWRRRRNGK
jgi:hypothetical protein